MSDYLKSAREMATEAMAQTTDDELNLHTLGEAVMQLCLEVEDLRRKIRNQLAPCGFCYIIPCLPA